MKIVKEFYVLIILICTVTTLSAQVGVGTTNPYRMFHIFGIEDQMVRVKSDISEGHAGLELVRGSAFGETKDWRVVNDIGKLKIQSSDNNFISDQSIMSLTTGGRIGIGTENPSATLHIATGEEASYTSHGYLLLGAPSGLNLVMDQNEIIARENGEGHGLTLQPNGGDIYLQENGGNLVMVVDSGLVGIGGAGGLGKVRVNTDDFHIQLRNSQGADNDWYIGATNDDWTVGGGQLIFSPGPTSAASKFRLRDIGESNGTIAPVEIHSAGNQALLIDGNEIDTDNGSLYFNHNSQSNTLLNPSGGQTSIGIITPQASLHVNTSPAQYAFTVDANGEPWNIHPYPGIQKLGFHRDDVAYAHVDVASGQWIALSDRRFKQDIQPMKSVLERLGTIDVKTYTVGNAHSQGRSIGVMAQQVQAVFPELVHEHDGQYALSYAQLAIVALKALQEQNEELELLEQELRALIRARNQTATKTSK